jgi:bifunctional damage-control phosphatase, subfamily II, fusion protein
MDGQKEYVQIDQNDLFPFLLVNVGSGVSIIKVIGATFLAENCLLNFIGSYQCSFSKVDGHGKFQRVSGTNVGGGTYWGLGRLMTKCKRCSFSAHEHKKFFHTNLLILATMILFQF